MPLTLIPDAIEEYAAVHSDPLPPLLQELADVTRQRLGERAGMLSGQVQAALLQMLALSLNARYILEIGMFTGFSAQAMAAALPDDGRLVTCEVDPEAIEIAIEFFARSPHGHKIDVRQGPALETMATLTGSFDLIFIDADKENYTAYYEAALPLLTPSGMIAVDNVLWGGRVLEPRDESDRAIAAFNAHVRQDERVRSVMLTVRDGLMLIRRS